MTTSWTLAMGRDDFARAAFVYAPSLMLTAHCQEWAEAVTRHDMCTMGL
jgi:hypothetical protein